MEKMLDISNLSVSYPAKNKPVEAVRGISLYISRGETVAVVGESGSGKSTVAHAVLGLLERQVQISGSVLFRGRELTTLTQNELRLILGREIGMIFQDPGSSLNPLMTVGAQIKESLRAAGPDGRTWREKALGLLKLVGISDPKRRLYQYPHELSGGMKQRVMTAMALACTPSLLIADEPTTSLDVTIQAQILEILSKLKTERGMSILLITHDFGIVREAADRVYVMYGGKIFEEAASGELLNNPLHPYTKGLLGSLPRPGAGRLSPIEGSPANAHDLPKGCPFSERCGRCMKVCLSHMPPFFEAFVDHRAACWLLDARVGREGTR
jgi:oligopeptide/dipeptide ABC transporter ATP-binding protein